MNDTGGHRSITPTSASRIGRAVVAALLVAAMLGLAAPVDALRSPNGPDSLSVYRIYRAALLREPDTAGLTYWYQAQLDGMTATNIAEHFVGSPEFIARYGHLDDRVFVEQMYQNVFGRGPDAAGADHWTARLADSSLSRGGVLLGFADSAEFKASTLASAAGPVDPESYNLASSRLDPCQPVSVYAHLEGAPPFAEGALEVAVLRMSDATGIEWRYLGAIEGGHDPDDWWTEELLDRENYIEVEWIPDLPYSGTFSWAVRPGPGHATTLAAVVTLGEASFESPHRSIGLALHQFGAIYGLDQVEQAGNVMHNQWTAAGWGVGDLEGFREIRRGGCAQVPGR